MNRRDQRKITKNLVALRKALQKDIDPIVDRLVKERVFTPEERSEIKNVRPALSQLRCGVFLNKLLRSGPDAYMKFRQILEDMGKYSLVDTLEKSTPKETDTVWAWTEEKEKTFVIPTPRLPDRLKEQKAESSTLRPTSETKPIDEVGQLERMMTFVMTTLDEKDKNNNHVDKKDFQNKLISESKGNEELIGFFKSLKFNSFSLTSQSLVSRRGQALTIREE